MTWFDPAGMRANLAKLRPFQKQLIISPADAAAIVVSLWSALAIRLGTVTPITFRGHGAWLLILMPIAGLIVLRQIGVYRVALRSMERRGVARIAQASAITALILAAISAFFPFIFIPRSTPIIFGLMMFVLLIATRVAGRDVYTWIIQMGAPRTPVVIYGAGASGTQLASSIANASEFRVVGFIDDDVKLWGRLVAGNKVSAPAQLDALIDKFGIEEVLLALPSASPRRRAEILHFLSERRVHVRTIPSLVELVSGTAGIDTLQEIDVDELLGRDTVAPQDDLFDTVSDKAVLVTGAGGSIGSELCRQAAMKGARVLVLLDVSEFALYLIERELRHSYSDLSIHPVLGSVGDTGLVTNLLRKHQIDTLFHAAAYKHVPLVETNAIEGVRNNTLGTLSVARAAIAANVPTAVLISTDKAVRPTNVMGASKRLAERVFASHQQVSNGTTFSMVRFGNVIGSSGSVIPLFQAQIAAGGPLTVTDPSITRYFMTIPEAAQLVIQASGMSAGGDLFLLDMGKPISIFDLARRMINLAGAQVKDEDHPDGDIEIVFTGLRPGEKLYEELLIEAEATPTRHPKIFRAIDADGTLTIETLLHDVEQAVNQRDETKLTALLLKWVEGYRADISRPVAMVEPAETNH